MLKPILAAALLTATPAYAGTNTALARIVALVRDAQSSKAPAQRLADLAGKYLVLVALAAQTGQVAWETVIGDRSEGPFGTSSGPIVIGGTRKWNITVIANCTRASTTASIGALLADEVVHQHMRRHHRVGVVAEQLDRAVLQCGLPLRSQAVAGQGVGVHEGHVLAGRVARRRRSSGF